MNILLLAACLAGCNMTGGTKPSATIRTTSPAVITVTPTPSVLSEKEWDRLTKACFIPPAPHPDAIKDKDPTDVAVDLANERKASLLECSDRMKELRKKLRKRKA